ncbi:MAG: acyl-CoA synthetase [Hyphomicrobiales bacterium]|nr:acyl-CoA synthetase [Hyphomicrobiales bacterium]
MNLPAPTSYATLVADFRWNIPERYNIGTDVCDRWARAEPSRPAIIEARADGSTKKVTFGDLRAASNRLANALKRRGIGPGERVAILLPQSSEVAIAHIAIYKLGAIAVPLAGLFGVDAIAYRLSDAGVTALVTDAAGLAKFRAIPERAQLTLVISLDGDDGDAQSFTRLCERESAEFPARETRPDDPALMIYTSGTTGPPKGALHGHRVLLGHLPCVAVTHEFTPQPGDRFWTPADWAWAGGLLNVLLPSLHHGLPVVARKFAHFDPEEALRLMANQRVRNTFIPPTALRMLRNVPNPRGRFDLSLRTIGSGGEALGAETLAWGREALGLTINEFYGQTECNLVLASCGALGVVKPGAIGKAVPGHEVEIIRADGTRCEPGEAGEIAIRRPDPVMFLEYWNRPDATRDKFIGDFMTTGDMGIRDEEGYVRFQGRTDDLITSAGYRIGPTEIEDCLIKHPAVALAAVVGKPDPLRTEIVKAFIVLKDGQAPSDALASDIQAFVRSRLSAHEYPREIAFRASLPLTTTGKVIRRQLRAEA